MAIAKISTPVVFDQWKKLNIADNSCVFCSHLTYLRSAATKGRVRSRFQLKNLAQMKSRLAQTAILLAAILLSIASVEPVRAQLGQQLNDLQQQVIRTYNSGNYELAAKQGEENIAIVRQHLGEGHPIYGIAISWNATIYMAMGRLTEAEQLFRQSLAIFQKTAPGNHPQLASAYNNVANALSKQGRHVEAHPFLQTAITLWEKSLPRDHPNLGLAFHNLAALYRELGRTNEAEPLLKRAMAIANRSGANELQLLVASELGMLYRDQKRFAEARPLLEQVVAAEEKTLSPDHPDLAASLHELGLLYAEQKLVPDAERVLKRALQIREKVLPATSRSTAATINNLAVLYESQGKFNESEALKKRSLSIYEKTLPPDHPDLATIHQNLSLLYAAKKDWPRSLDHIRKSSSILLTRNNVGDLIRNSNSFTTHVLVANRVDANATALRSETYEMAQWANLTKAASTLSQMSARQSKGDGPLSAMVRQRQDLENQWLVTDRVLSAAMAAGDNNKIAQARKQMAALAADYLASNAKMVREFPEYASLTNPKPLSITDTQNLLSADEALLQLIAVNKTEATPSETYAWLLTKNNARWFKVALSPDQIASSVERLRCSLDFASWVYGRAKHCAALFKGAATDQPLPFDFSTSHQLYAALFGPVQDLIENKHLLIVPTAGLTQLPFQVLITEKPEIPIGLSVSALRGAKWLVRKHAITVLPSVSSLKSLRQQAQKSSATLPLAGFGNPLLNGPDASYADEMRLARTKQVCGTGPITISDTSRGRQRALRAFTVRNGTANVEDIRSQVPLPDTADELCAVASNLGVGANDIRLGARATETEIKRMSDSGQLSKYRILHFATHGAVAGEVSGNTEPGLIMTPPQKGTDIDDGYLSASEITGLKLNADWVILSACNTAAGSSEDSEALAGLTSAFFYAGARAVLVSHWAVSSSGTVKLITGAFNKIGLDNNAGRAEAMRQSMLAMIDHGEGHESNPAIWAPFAIVGEGSAAK